MNAIRWWKNIKQYKMHSDKENIFLRAAEEGDLDLIAWTVLRALDMDTRDLERVKESCADVLSMYSWNKSIVACIDGKPVGAIVSYPGDDYDSLRHYTWPRLWNVTDTSEIDAMQAEALPGEYYLDSLAILPGYRGRGIGKLLIHAAMRHGRKLGYTRFSLLVDVGKPRLKTYYESIGFKEHGEMVFFGHHYNIMRYSE